MNENGQLEELEILPDLENEQIESMPPPKSGGCGCNKNKNVAAQSKSESKGINWQNIIMIAVGVGLVYLLFIKKGKVEVPKVEVPEV